MDDIQSLIEELRFGAEYGSDAELLERAADKIQELVADLGDADAMTEYWMKKNKWIKCSERLPKDGEFVLVCNDDGHMMIAKHESETFEWYYKYTNYDFDVWDNDEQGPVLYWQPLPDAPEVGA